MQPVGFTVTALQEVYPAHDFCSKHSFILGCGVGGVLIIDRWGSGRDLAMSLELYRKTWILCASQVPVA